MQHSTEADGSHLAVMHNAPTSQMFCRDAQFDLVEEDPLNPGLPLVSSSIAM